MRWVRKGIVHPVRAYKMQIRYRYMYGIRVRCRVYVYFEWVGIVIPGILKGTWAASENTPRPYCSAHEQ